MKNDCYNITHADPFVHGEMPPREREEFERHLDDCDQCRREVKDLRSLSENIDAAYSVDLDETFNYSVLNEMRNPGRLGGVKEIRLALEDIVISLATLIVVALLGIQLFNRPAVSPLEMAGSLTNIEKSSAEQQTLSNDQVLELVMRSK